jgi:hypothetical protein
MVVHQDVGVKCAVRCRERLAQQLQVSQSVTIIKEAGQAIIAPLDHMLREAGQIKAREACHADEHEDAGGSMQSGEPMARFGHRRRVG